MNIPAPIDDPGSMRTPTASRPAQDEAAKSQGALDLSTADMSSSPCAIAHVLPWKAIGGTESGTLRVARSAAQGGLRSLMLCRTDAPLVCAYFTEHGFEVVTFDAPQMERGFFRKMRESLRVMRALRARGVEVVHCADVYGGDFFAIAARLAGCRVVCHVRNRYEWLSRQQRVWIAFVTKLVFVSEDTANRFGRLARGGRTFIDSRRVVLYDGIPERLSPIAPPAVTRRRLGIAEDAIVVGMVARISVQKDHLTLVEAANVVCERHPRALFVFIGDDGSEGGAEPENARRVKEAIARSPHRGRFLCTGYRRDVPDLIAMLDIFVLCTHREGLPLVILEAMAEGKPVIATAVDGIPEIVKDRETGLLHAHEDAGDLARCLDELLGDPVLARDMGAAGRRFANDAFSERAFVTNVLSLYDGLVTSPAGRGKAVAIDTGDLR